MTFRHMPSPEQMREHHAKAIEQGRTVGVMPAERADEINRAMRAQMENAQTMAGIPAVGLGNVDVPENMQVPPPPLQTTNPASVKLFSGELWKEHEERLERRIADDMRKARDELEESLRKAHEERRQQRIADGVQRAMVEAARQAMDESEASMLKKNRDETWTWDEQVKFEAAIESREIDPHGRDPHEPGAKLDAAKIPLRKGCLDQFPMAMEAIADVSAYGAQKYTWGGWISVPNGIERYLDAAARHAKARALGHKFDGESRRRHLAHEAWCILAALEMEIREIGGPEGTQP